MAVRIRRASGAPVVLGNDASAATSNRSSVRTPARPARKAKPSKATAKKVAAPARKTVVRGRGKQLGPDRVAGKRAKGKQPELFAGEAPKAPPAPPKAEFAPEPKQKASRRKKADAAAPSVPLLLPEEATTDGRPATRRRATAESMAHKQRDISVSEFFMKNRHLLGFDSPARALLTTVKEGVDNSLDAAEEAGILPSVAVELIELAEDRFRVIIEDNGPGIVKAQIPKVFGKLLYGSKFHRLRQGRGQQGIGISAAGMYGQMTTGKPIVITSKTGKGRPAHHFEIVIDTARNAPNVVKDETVEWDKDHGTRVEIELQGTYKAGRRSVDEYIEQVAIANPHAEITFRPPKGRPAVYVARATTEMPREPLEIKPHPYGVELGMLQKILQDTEAKSVTAALQSEFSRVTPKVAEEIITKAKLSTRARTRDLKPADVERLHKAIPEVKIFAPPSACVVPIGEDLLRKGLEREIKAEFYTSTTRPPAVYRGNPFQIEVGLAYGGSLRSADEDDENVHATGKETDAQQGPITLLRLANRVPLQYQQSSCAVFKAVVDTNWRGYGLAQPRGSLPQGPMVLIVHIASVWVPFTSESKEAVAHYDEILKEMQLALQDCGRKLGSFLRRREAERHELRRRSIFEMYIGELVESLGKLTPVDRAKLQRDLAALARKHTGDSDEDVAAMLTATKRVVKRGDELNDDERATDGDAAPSARANRTAPSRGNSKSKAGQRTSKRGAANTQLDLLDEED